MKPTFKTTAVAMLVALGVTACNSNKPSSEEAAPPKQVTPAEPTQPAQPEQPTQPAQPAEPSQPVQPSQPVTPVEPVQPVVPTQPVQPETPAQPAVPNQQDRVNKELAQIPTVNQENWNVEIPVKVHTAVKSNLDQFDLSYIKRDDVALPSPYKGEELSKYSTFENTPSDVTFSLTEQTKKDIQNGGQYLGKHEGVFTNPNIDNFIVTAESNASEEKNYLLKGVSVDRSSKDINYLYINNPYSAYGVLFTNEHDQKFFYTGLDSRNYGNLYENVNNTSERNYVESLKGDVNYKGDVIATVSRGIAGSTRTMQESPKVDGTITLNAHFGKFVEENSIKGQLVSDSVGTVELLPAGLDNQRFDFESNFSGKVQQLDQNNKNKFYAHFLNGYSGRLVGKEGQDIIGSITLIYNYEDIHNHDGKFKLDEKGNNPINEYNAVFGATKQPK